MGMPTLLFLRAYHAFQGGHLKVADYMRHARDGGLFTPQLHLMPGSRADHPFPRDIITPHWRPEQADALFLAGMDWAHVPPGIEEQVPVINLIQHPRHAQPDDPRFAFLGRRATRLCVSEAIAQALRASGHANGPIHTIPAGLDLSAIPRADKSVDVLICGLKNPALAQATARMLGGRARLLTEAMPRPAYLAMVARTHVAITLPDPAEGFYLPALEAMAAGCAVICPDALGNRAFCRDGETCLMPPPTAEALCAAALALMTDPTLARKLQTSGLAEARRHTLGAEAMAFHALLAAMTASYA
jgi:hypothetical protein